MRNRAGRGMARAAALTLGLLPPVGPQVPEVTDAGGADVASRLLPKEPCSLPSKECSHTLEKRRAGGRDGGGDGGRLLWVGRPFFFFFNYFFFHF